MSSSSGSPCCVPNWQCSSLQILSGPRPGKRSQRRLLTMFPAQPPLHPGLVLLKAGKSNLCHSTTHSAPVSTMLLKLFLPAGEISLWASLSPSSVQCSPNSEALCALQCLLTFGLSIPSTGISGLQTTPSFIPAGRPFLHRWPRMTPPSPPVVLALPHTSCCQQQSSHGNYRVCSAQRSQHWGNIATVGPEEKTKHHSDDTCTVET